MNDPIIPKQRPESYGSNEERGNGSEKDMPDDLKGHKTFKGLIHDFAEKTSVPGLLHIKIAKNWVFRIFWIVGTIATLVACSIHIYKLTKLYLSSPKQTDVQLEFATLTFPAVTICNTNAIRLSRLYNLSDKLVKFTKEVSPEKLSKTSQNNESQSLKNTAPLSKHRLKRWADIFGYNRSVQNKKLHRIAKRRPLLKKKQQIGNKTWRCRYPRGKGKGRRPGQNWPCRKVSGFLKQMERVNTSAYQEMAKHDRQQKRNEEIGPREATSLIMSQYKLLYSKLDAKTRFEAGHQVEDLILSCSFRGRDCEHKKFTLSQSLDYGNCYTIQSKNFEVDSSGPTEGLSVVLFMENHEYIKGISNGYGARVVIHDANTTDFPTQEGFFVSSQTETNIGLRHVDIIRLGKPYGDCTDGEDFLSKYKIKYTRQTCQRFCEVEEVLTKCKCFSRRLEDVFLKINRSVPQTLKACSSDAELNCSYSIEDNIRKHRRQTCSKCRNPCVEKVYSRATSHRIWPTEAYMKLLFSAVCNKYGNASTSCKDLRQSTKVRARGLNFLKMNIYFEDLNYERIQETPSYEEEQYFSDIGGAVGLWIGLSVLSFLEVGQLALEVAHFIYMKVAGGKR